MTEERASRKMSAILSADVKDYSRLMSADEERTVKDLNACREIIAGCVQEHRGRVVDSPGDNVLAEFASTVEAVKCAVEIQKELKVRNADRPEDMRMEFRIGVNLGDVIEEKGRIYGDGVNIAARLEGLAVAGGICISGTAFDQVKGKLLLGFEFAGEQTVKNIPDPVRAYKVLMDEKDAGKLIGVEKKAPKSRWMEIAAVVVFVAIGLIIYQFYVSKQTPPVEEASAEKPSIAILPFENMSNDPQQEYFSDGLTDELIGDLAKISGILVISRNSAFTYKGKQVKISQVARELNVRYVLEGSVQKSGDKVRIRAQLIDGQTDHHLWSDSYDGVLKNIFSLQDRITKKIVAALAIRLTPDEKENLASKGTDNIEAYDAFLKGWQYYLRDTPESFAQAISDFNKAIEFDFDYSEAYAALALIYLKAKSGKDWYKALQTDYFTARVKARHYLNIAMKKPTSLAYRVASSMDLKRRNHDEALLYAEKAIAINPSGAESLISMAEVSVYSGRPKEAIKFINEVMRLDPNRMADCLRLLGIAHFCLEEYEEAIAAFNRSLKYNPDSWVYDWLASAHANIGNDNDARTAFEIEKKRWLEVSAKGETARITELDLQPTVYSQPFNNPEVIKRFVGGLIKAGWPEPHRYYEAYRENKLTGDEVRNLVIGRTQVLAGFAGGGWTQKFTKDGNVSYQGFGMKDSGKFSVEGDQCCITYAKMMASLPLCADLYRNPGGTLEKKDEYLLVNDFGMYPVSYVE